MSLADFVEETTTSIAGSSGDGAVTLSAQGNYPRFSSAFGTGTRLVHYVIEKASNGYVEKGLGSVASNVLTRTAPQVTWNGTTWDDTAPAALQFGASPTAGDVRIRMAPVTDIMMRTPHAFRRGTSNHRFASGSNAYLPSAHIPAANSGAAGVASSTSLEYYQVYYNPCPGRLVGFGVSVSTAVASSGVKMGLYEIGSNGLPGPCICQSNAISTAATGLAVDETPGTWPVNAGPLRPGVGWFYLGFQFSHANVAILRMPMNLVGHNMMATPLGHVDSYAWGHGVTKTNENTYSTGLPTGTPTGSYTILGANSTSAGWMGLLSVENT